ncbi:MAG: PEGA domain-containing protein [Candidatus Eisenbacteria bacterium]
MNRLPGWIALFALVVLTALGCAQKKRLTIEVKEGTAGVSRAEIFEAGTRTRLAVTAPGGRATLTVQLKKGNKLRLEVREPNDRTRYRYDGPIEIDDARLRAGVVLVRAFPLDSLAMSGEAELALISEPAGADVFLDDEAKGHTPLTLSHLTPGRVRLELRLAGFHPVKEELVLQAEALTKIDTLIPIAVTTASLTVYSDPDGAEVFLDGKATGRSTPGEWKGLSPGAHRVRIVKQGYVPYEREVRLEAGGSGRAGGLLETLASREVASRQERGGGNPSGGSSNGSSLRATTPSSTGGKTTPADKPATQSGPARRYRVSPAPNYADVWVDGKAVNAEKQAFFSIELSPGTHVFHPDQRRSRRRRLDALRGSG